MTSTVIIGGTGGLGRVLAQHFADRGDQVLITSRDAERAEQTAKEIGAAVTGLAVDLTRPGSVADSLRPIASVDRLVITAIHQTTTAITNFDIEDATTAVTVKLVGTAAVVEALRDRFTPDAALVLFGGLAMSLPYPGSTMVTTVNAGISGLARTLAAELAPVRVNVLHPGLVGDSPKWRDRPTDAVAQRTPIGRLVTMEEVIDASDFLLRNAGMNAHDLHLNGGVLVR